ncbi:ATP-binding cassette domain-containing protein [Roseibium salinum]|nr:ATP-binding cassette domain-containing protein [Roseibium salinum]
MVFFKHFGERDTRVDALRGVSLNVNSGEVVALLGPSGSGKTTLLNVIGCIVEPNAGRLSIDGDIVFKDRWLSSNLRRLRLEKIGFIFPVPQPSSLPQCHGQRRRGPRSGGT